MKVHTATLAGGSSNADRVFVAEHAVILLDGASAFAPVDVDPGDYAAALGGAIAEQLDRVPTMSLSDAVADAISHVTAALRLGAGPSPSSTVTILRVRDEVADLYVLGDSPLYYGTTQDVERFSDDRMAALALPERQRYRTELARGSGYADEHRARLVDLQNAQRAHRNRAGGYWIAETVPDAAHHALTAAVPTDRIAWAVLATDGAADAIEHHNRPSWHEVAQLSDEALSTMLDRLHEWEANTDPDGRLLPRAKRHDDKTVAAIPALW